MEEEHGKWQILLLIMVSLSTYNECEYTQTRYHYTQQYHDDTLSFHFIQYSGYMVIVPDYYRGAICDVTKEELETIMKFLRDESVWEGKLKDDWEKSIFPYATENGATSFGTIGGLKK